MTDQQRFLLAAVIGWPVMHSRSPLMHNYWFDKLGLAGAYVPLAIEPGTLEPALRALHPLGFAGCNLTIPHKQDAMTIVDDVDDTAKAIGAISCVVVRPDGALFGTNNDWFGFINNLKQQHPSWRADSGPITVLGAGGGSRAVCYGLLREGATEIRLVNRTQQRAEVLAEEIGGPITVYPWSERDAVLDGSTMAVNTTSQVMIGEPALAVTLDRLPADALVADIIYIPLETPFLEAARLRGNPTINGLGMLLHQGRPAWRMWFDIEPDVTAELTARMERSILDA
jgi:shikimate dehydrogenase